MIAALFIATALSSHTISAEATAQTTVERLQEACVATNMMRASFDQTFAGRGLEPLIPVVRQGEARPTEWSEAYRDGPVDIVLTGQPGSSEATDCGVLARHPEDSLRAEMQRLAEQLRMQPTASEEDPDVIEARSWTAGGERPLTLHYEFYRDAVVVRLARPAPNTQ